LATVTPLPGAVPLGAGDAVPLGDGAPALADGVTVGVPLGAVVTGGGVTVD
jgi:hypothetical protein